MLFCKIFVVKKFSFAQNFYMKWLTCTNLYNYSHTTDPYHDSYDIIIGFLEVDDVDRFSEVVWLFKCLIDSTKDSVKI